MPKRLRTKNNITDPLSNLDKPTHLAGNKKKSKKGEIKSLNSQGDLRREAEEHNDDVDVGIP